MKKILAILLICFSIHAFPQSLTVATAANVQYAMHDIKNKFEKVTGIQLKIIIGSSGKLTAQITNDAPFDVFLSADMKYPDSLYSKGFAITVPKVYAKGSLVLWSLSEIDLSKGVMTLLNKRIENIAIANPITAPYGRESVKVLKYYKILDAVKDKLVYGTSIAQTNQYIVTKAAQIGFTAKSVVLSPKLKNKGVWYSIDPESYSPIEQGIIILKHGEKFNKKAAEEFYKFIFSHVAKQIFKRYGYKVN